MARSWAADKVSEPAQMVATDNGSPANMNVFELDQCKAFSGLGLGILRTKEGKAGRVTVKVEAEGLDAAII